MSQLVPKKLSKNEQNDVARALKAAMLLRPEKEKQYRNLEAKFIPKTKQKRFLTDLTAEEEDAYFSEDAIAQAIKKQRALTEKRIQKNNIKTSTKVKKNKDSMRGNIDSDDDSDNDSDNDDNDNTEKNSKSMTMVDNDDNDDNGDYEGEYDVDEFGKKLVALTPALLSLHTVRTHDEDEMDKIKGKQAEDIYLRRKKVTSHISKDGTIIKRDASGNEVIHDDQKRLDRTIYLGNVSNDAKDSDIKTFLGVPIETLRYRSAGFDTQKLSRWVAFAQKRFHEKRDSLSVFVVLKSIDDIPIVLAKNQELLLGKHVRVDLAASDAKVDPPRSIFIGNLPYDITEETLYEEFSKIGTIDAIRCVRDPNTGIGKGFSFVTFIDKSSVPIALKLNEQQSELIGRRLRITKVSPNAFGKTATFKAEQEKQKMLLQKQRRSTKSISSKLKAKVLGDDLSSTTSNTTNNKRIKIQGAYQKVVGNAGVGRSKKERHNPVKHDQPSWMGTRAKPSDSLGRNKATKKPGNGKNNTKAKPKKGKH